MIEKANLDKFIGLIDSSDIDPYCEDEIIETIHLVIYDNNEDFSFYDFLLDADEEEVEETNLSLCYQTKTLYYYGTKKVLRVRAIDLDENGIKFNSFIHEPLITTSVDKLKIKEISKVIAERWDKTPMEALHLYNTVMLALDNEDLKADFNNVLDVVGRALRIVYDKE